MPEVAVHANRFSHGKVDHCSLVSYNLIYWHISRPDLFGVPVNLSCKANTAGERVSGLVVVRRGEPVRELRVEDLAEQAEPPLHPCSSCPVAGDTRCRGSSRGG